VRHFPLPLFFLIVLLASAAIGQSPNGTISGLVLDPSERPIPGAEILIANDATGVRYPGSTNGEGIYAVANLPPGSYRIQVSRAGFKTLIKPDIVLNVQDALAINFTLPLGAIAETVTVQGGAPLVDTESAAVSTVVDRNFAENLPMNGRSFQSLIDLTPGVVLTVSTNYDAGQFSVNGQRASSNYWMVDGVSANVGVSTYFPPGNGFGGALGSFSTQGGTNSLVSVDALQEFRIQTSTYAPEFGRTPGAQISIATRSGTNRLHGTLFDYLRNDIFDANDWFASENGQRKPAERQNDFGGTFDGPIVKDRTFFFFSYEGLRLRLPRFALTQVPDVQARQSAAAPLQPYLNAFPLPNGAEILNAQGNPTGGAKLNASFSDSSTLDAYSLRVDHKLRENLTLFGRYNFSPSETLTRGADGADSLSEMYRSSITTQTSTVGVTALISPAATNDLRLNYSSTGAVGSYYLDNFNGAVPLASLLLPGTYSTQNSQFFLDVFALSGGQYSVGDGLRNTQRQVNIVDTVALQKSTHGLKFGVDYRRLSPVFAPLLYSQGAFFNDVPSLEAGNLSFSFMQSHVGTTLLFHNLGVYAQDTWRVFPRLTLTYGVRWDVDFAPSSSSGPNIPAVTGFNLDDLSQLNIAPAGTPAFKTPYRNIAPRLGVAYQFSQRPDWVTVFRGGFGVFFDLASQESGNLIGQFAYPFAAYKLDFGNVFPLPDAVASPPPITPPGSGSGTVLAFDPNLQLPYTLQWNASLEQSLGRQQSLSGTYIGAVGRRLIQTAQIFSPNANYAQAVLVGNTATSDYNALQLQFQRRLSRGLQALASFSWSHSIDTGSAGSFGNAANTLVPGLNPSANRGPSDFDVRNSFSAGLTYDAPVPKGDAPTTAILRDWSIQSIIQARSAPPTNVFDSKFSELADAYTSIRPDFVPGQPLYLFGSLYPGGKAFNPAAFTPPPTDSNGNPLRQGDVGRNALRGFGATQWDFAVHRDFSIYESLKLQFRAEMFNLLNHPNVAQPVADISNPQFGLSTQMLGQSLGGGNLGGGGFSPQYQLGGPRSIQFALKFIF
jgi:hypothetical protein